MGTTDLHNLMISVVNMRCGSACLRVLFILKTAYSPTVLEKSFPTHIVCSGMGNSLQVARKHDLQTMYALKAQLKRRDELLDREVVETLLEAKVLTKRWRQEYNTVRPHSSLGYRPPAPTTRMFTHTSFLTHSTTAEINKSRDETTTSKVDSFPGAGHWDIERRRYPQYEHAAVIVAENITSRFLNVISLFNGHIPLIAIQMSALKVGDGAGLVFSMVVDLTTSGLVDADEETQETTDRAYWEKRGARATVALTDELLKLAQQSDPALELKYNRFYIGLAKNGKPNNCVQFKPQKKSLRIEPQLPQSDEIEEKLESANIDVMNYIKRWGRYRIRVSKADVKDHEVLLKEIFAAAFRACGQ